MTYKKGQSGNPNGRPKGSKNKQTAAIRDRVSSFLEANFYSIEQDIKKLTPKERIDVLIKMLEYAVPKLQRSEVTNVTTLEEFVQMSDEERLGVITTIKSKQNVN